jgi:hypothetical protein
LEALALSESIKSFSKIIHFSANDVTILCDNLPLVQLIKKADLDYESMRPRISRILLAIRAFPFKSIRYLPTKKNYLADCISRSILHENKTNYATELIRPAHDEMENAGTPALLTIPLRAGVVGEGDPLSAGKPNPTEVNLELVKAHQRNDQQCRALYEWLIAS